MMRWYVLHCKPHKENLLHKQLCLRRIETYYPCLRVKPVNPRACKIRPYFPGYLFVKVDLNIVGISNLQWLPGVRNIVTLGDEPAFVSNTILQTIRRKVEEINQAGGETLYSVKHGDLVGINSGPFAGYHAIFDTRLSGKDRVRVFLQMLQDHQVSVVLSGGQIERVQ